MTPYIVGHLGVERYGTWAIIGVLTGYLGLLDLGIGTSFVKYIAEFSVKKDHNKINELINTGFVFYSGLGTIIVVLGFILVDPLLTLFHFPPTIYAEASFVFILALLLFNVSNALSCFTSILEGMQRMDISNKVNIVMAVPNVIGTVYFLEKGYGLRGLMLNNAINFILLSIIKVIISMRIFPEIKLDPRRFNKSMFSKLLKFGYKLQFSRLAYLVNFQTDKLLITYFLGIGYVAYYQLGVTVLQKVREIPLLMVSALVPAVSEIESTHGQGMLRELYIRGSKYLIFVSTPLLFFLLTNASTIMLAWMGSGYERAALVIQLLGIGYFAATVSGVASTIAVGVAKTEFEMRYGVLMVPLNLFLSCILVQKFGFAGAVMGTSLSLVVGAIFFILMFQKYLKTRPSLFASLFIKPAGICVVPALIMIFFNNSIWSVNVTTNRAVLLVMLGVNCLMFGAVYLTIVRLSRYFDNDDFTLLKHKLPLFRFLVSEHPWPKIARAPWKKDQVI